MSNTVAAVAAMDEDNAQKNGTSAPTKERWVKRWDDFTSIWMALALSAITLLVFLYNPAWQPSEFTYRYLMPWGVLAYLGPQMRLLVMSFKHTQEISFSDLVLSLSPAGAGGLVLGIHTYKWYQNTYTGGHGLLLSPDALNLVALIIVTSLIDAMVTVSVKMAMKGRTISTN
jgi:hypothetical protein